MLRYAAQAEGRASSIGARRRGAHAAAARGYRRGRSEEAGEALCARMDMSELPRAEAESRELERARMICGRRICRFSGSCLRRRSGDARGGA
jgi:hypothetical protein